MHPLLVIAIAQLIVGAAMFASATMTVGGYTLWAALLGWPQ